MVEPKTNIYIKSEEEEIKVFSIWDFVAFIIIHFWCSCETSLDSFERFQLTCLRFISYYAFILSKVEILFVSFMVFFQICFSRYCKILLWTIRNLFFGTFINCCWNCLGLKPTKLKQINKHCYNATAYKYRNLNVKKNIDKALSFNIDILHFTWMEFYIWTNSMYQTTDYYGSCNWPVIIRYKFIPTILKRNKHAHGKFGSFKEHTIFGYLFMEYAF